MAPLGRPLGTLSNPIGGSRAFYDAERREAADPYTSRILTLPTIPPLADLPDAASGDAPRLARPVLFSVDVRGHLAFRICRETTRLSQRRIAAANAIVYSTLDRFPQHAFRGAQCQCCVEFFPAAGSIELGGATVSLGLLTCSNDACHYQLCPTCACEIFHVRVGHFCDWERNHRTHVPNLNLN